jgi:ssDNA-binding Zn-finger/Zn-ribbon topoisomerase 1
VTAGTTSTGRKLWTETDGAARVLQKEAEKRQQFQCIKAGLAKCPVCRKEAKIVRFGLGGKGIWIGCDRTEDCSRYIEFHAEGWSIEDTARDWNRRNRGWRKVLRRIKRGFYDRFGHLSRAEKRLQKEIKAKKEKNLAKRREIFGIFAPQRKKSWWIFGKKGNK